MYKMLPFSSLNMFIKDITFLKVFLTCKELQAACENIDVIVS